MVQYIFQPRKNGFLVALRRHVFSALRQKKIVTKADNRGEGGILSLMSLAKTGFSGKASWVIALGVVGNLPGGILYASGRSEPARGLD